MSACTLVVRCGCAGGGKGALVSDDVSLTLSTANTQTLFADEGETMIVRRLTPLECERLQGYPDGWTDVPGASDSARYKALGNSVAIPCVEYLMQRVAMVITLDLEWDF